MGLNTRLRPVPVLVVVVLVLAFAGGSSEAQESSSGKNTAAMTGEFDPPPGCLQDVPIGTIEKGKKGHLLIVEMTASGTPEGFPGARIFSPEVNGTNLEGPASVDSPDSSQFDNAAVSAVWWLDFDAAESNNPGEIVGQPLALAFGQLCGSDPYRVTAVARMLKK